MGRILAIDDSCDAKLVGSLSSYLAILARAGFLIADGFVIPIDVPLKDGLSNEILRHFDRLGCDRVTIRSSSESHEIDGEALRDVHREALIDAVRYLQNNIHRRGRKAAIVIQKHLRAEISGTAHSIDPVSNDHNAILIEAHLWMNDTVLTGASEPDIFAVNKRSGTLYVDADKEDDICLDSKQIEMIYNLVRKAERKSATPISIDWAFNDGRLYILRVRPITAKTRERYI